MIKKPNNWNEVKEFSERQKLPVGAYVCRVKNAVVRNTDFGEQLNIVFDIAYGEYAGYYKNDFDSSTVENKKYKGVLRQFIPKDDGSEQDEWTKSAFKGLITSFEKSNRGYVWNWDESSLINKEVGILMRNEEWEMNGKTGWATRPFRAISVDSVEDGDYRIPADKPLKNKTTTNYTAPAQHSNYGFTPIESDDGDLPF